MSTQAEAANTNIAPQVEGDGGGELLADAKAKLDVPVETEVREEMNRWARIVSDLEVKRGAANDDSKPTQIAA